MSGISSCPRRSSARRWSQRRFRLRATCSMSADRQAPVQRRVLGDEGDVVERAGGARRLAAEHGERARRGPGQADGHGEQGGLAGAVRADEGDDVAARDGERAVAQRPPAAVALAEFAGLYDVHDWLR